MQVYIDESGNIVSSMKAPCFVLAALILKDDLPIKRCIKDIRRKKIKKKYQKTSELKFNASDDAIKRRVLECIGRTNNDIGYAFLCSPLQQEIEPHIIYSDICKRLIYQIINDCGAAGKVDIIIDKALYGVQRAKFDAYIADRSGNVLPPSLESVNVAHVDSKGCPYIQAVDFIAGAINRKYRDNDDLFYQMIQHRIATILKI
jgi:hypothetical protein